MIQTLFVAIYQRHLNIPLPLQAEANLVIDNITGCQQNWDLLENSKLIFLHSLVLIEVNFAPKYELL